MGQLMFGQGDIWVTDIIVGTADSGSVGVWRYGRRFCIQRAACRVSWCAGRWPRKATVAVRADGPHRERYVRLEGDIIETSQNKKSKRILFSKG